MRLILIRHGDPDYTHDSLTEKGLREAELLAKRVAHWKVDDVYVSPLGRAKKTAEPLLKALQKQAKVLDWAEEFFPPNEEGEHVLLWDYFPRDWTETDENFRESEWLNTPIASYAKPIYEKTCKELDSFLSSYGYERRGRAYRITEHSDKTVMIVCHFGISMIFLSHLLNISAQTLLHGFFLPPTSVTVLNTEERRGDEAYFRVERFGDCSHLILGDEPISESGYFAPLMQELPHKK